MEKLTRPFRCPNNVPEIFVPVLPPMFMWYWPSAVPFGNAGNLHTGVMMGKDRNTERKTRTTFVLCFLF